MYKDYFPVENESMTTASTPELWATFAESKRFSASMRRQLLKSTEWSLIQRYVANGGAMLDAGCGAGAWVEFLRE